MVGAHIKGARMKNLDLRRYERLLVELIRNTELTPEQRKLLEEHRDEVAQLRYLSDPAGIDRDSKQVRKWIDSEWARFKGRMPRRVYHLLHDSLFWIVTGAPQGTAGLPGDSTAA